MKRAKEGAAMIRTQGEALRHGNIVETVKNVRNVMKEIRILNKDEDEVFAFGKNITAPYTWEGCLWRSFAVEGIMTPVDAELVKQLGCDGNFVGLWLQCRLLGIAFDPHVLVKGTCGLKDTIAEVNLSEDRIEHLGRD